MTQSQDLTLDLTAREIADGIRPARFSMQSVVAESIRRAEIAQARLNPFTLIRAGQAILPGPRGGPPHEGCQACPCGHADGPLGEASAAPFQ